MASQFHCDLCQAEAAVILITNLSNGDVFALGPEHVQEGLTAFATSLEPDPAPADPAAPGDTPTAPPDPAPVVPGGEPGRIDTAPDPEAVPDPVPGITAPPQGVEPPAAPAPAPEPEAPATPGQPVQPEPAPTEPGESGQPEQLAEAPAAVPV